MLVWTCLEPQKKKGKKIKNKRRGKEIGNVTMKILTPSWQGSISALLASFVPSFSLFSFVLEKVYLPWHNGVIILYV